MATRTVNPDSAQAKPALNCFDVVNDIDDIRADVASFEHMLFLANDFEAFEIDDRIFRNTVSAARTMMRALEAKAAALSEKYQGAGTMQRAAAAAVD